MIPNLDLATIKSIFDIDKNAFEIVSKFEDINLDKFLNIFSSSLIIRADISLHSLQKFTASSGSIKSVEPDCETSWTIPGTLFLFSGFTSSTNLLFFEEIIDDCRKFLFIFS